MSKQLRAVISALCIASLAGCGGGGDHSAAATATIGGTVTGLVGKVVLQNNAGDNLSVTANGAFTFGTSLNNGATYAVTVLTQPPGPTCVVANGSGTATANVTSVSVTCTTDPSTVFLPTYAIGVPDSTGPGTTGLFVISSKSPGDPPIQIATGGITSLGFQPQYTVSAQGTVSSGNPYALIYTTQNSTSGDHVWLLSLSGTSSLVPTQLSNLTIPYYTETIISHTGTEQVPVQTCSSQVIQKNLADPSSTLLILALPTDTTSLCGGSPAGFKWVLIHSSDSPTTDPVNLPSALSAPPFLPLYRPDGTLAGLVAQDTSNNVNFYADETFSNPRLLIANVEFLNPAQERPSGPISRISVNPTYSFLMVRGGNVASGAAAVYRIDYSGTMSADLYDLFYSTGVLVDSNNLYFTATTAEVAPDTFGENVGRIPGDGGSVQILQSMVVPPPNIAPALSGVSGSNLVLWGTTGTSAQTQWYVATLPTGAPGTLTTIATNDNVPGISLADGDIFVTWADYLNITNNFDARFSSEILDTNGNVLQSNTPSSSFITSAGPVLQVINITDPIFLGGGSVNLLDLSQPSSPTAVALKTTAGMAFSFPSGTGSVEFRPVSSTIGVADGAAVQGQNSQPAYVYDLAKGVIVPISMPNSALSFMTY
jgi:hypothetical protein